MILRATAFEERLIPFFGFTSHGVFDFTRGQIDLTANRCEERTRIFTCCAKLLTQFKADLPKAT